MKTEESQTPAFGEATYHIEAVVGTDKSNEEKISVAVTLDATIQFDDKKAKAIFKAAYPNLSIILRRLSFERVD